MKFSQTSTGTTSRCHAYWMCSGQSHCFASVRPLGKPWSLSSTSEWIPVQLRLRKRRIASSITSQDTATSTTHHSATSIQTKRSSPLKSTDSSLPSQESSPNSSCSTQCSSTLTSLPTWSTAWLTPWTSSRTGTCSRACKISCVTCPLVIRSRSETKQARATNQSH